MDALEFLRERERMCNSYDGCKGCPCEKVRCALNSLTSDNDYKRVVAIVEQWAKEHPRKTRQSVFLEQYPQSQMNDSYGCLMLCPKYISTDYREKYVNCADRGCIDCLLDFWMQEVE